MFTESAELYDAIYFTFKDYGEESARIAERIRAEMPSAHTVLDVACGTGEHARLLSTQHGFDVDGIDLNPEFVRLAKGKNPSGRFTVADMVDFDLGRQYDAVICMFSSIGYVLTLPRVEQTLRNFQRHCAPGGVIIVEPWFPPGKLTPGHHSTRRAVVDGTTIERSATNEIAEKSCRLRFDYRIEDATGVRVASEIHELGLFTEDEMLAAFAAVGLPVVHEAATATHRGLYIARC